MGALCRGLSFVHLLLTATILACKQRRRGTTTQFKHFFFTEKNNEFNNVIPFAKGEEEWWDPKFSRLDKNDWSIFKKP